LPTLVKSHNPGAASIEEFVDAAFIAGTLAIVESGAVANQPWRCPISFSVPKLHKIALLLSSFEISTPSSLSSGPQRVSAFDLAALPSASPRTRTPPPIRSSSI
jgi:hypothetical protein